MAFFVKRWYSSAVLRDPYAHARPSVANPCPVHQGPVLGSPELQKLAQKAKGHWKDLSKEEAVQLYRASFPATFKELTASRGDYRKVIPAVVLGVLAGAFLSYFLSKTIGPERPHTYNNPEWEAATREYLLRQQSNPIEGISSKQKS